METNGGSGVCKMSCLLHVYYIMFGMVIYTPTHLICGAKRKVHDYLK